MSNRISKAIRATACVIGLLLFLMWGCVPVVVALASTNKVEAVDSQKEEFTTNINESTTPEVESESSVGPEVETEDQGESSFESEETMESVADEVVEPEEESSEAVHGIALTDEEKEMFATIIYLEGGGESYECQMAIGSVILNRLAIGYWGDTLEKVLYAPNQFSPANRISITTPTQEQRDIVEQLLSKGTTMPYYVLYFRAWYYFDWAIPYTNIGDVYFSYVERDV